LVFILEAPWPSTRSATGLVHVWWLRVPDPDFGCSTPTGCSIAASLSLVAMVRAFLNLSSPRKRAFLLKSLLLALVCLGIIFWWGRSPPRLLEQASHPLRVYEKAEFPFVGVEHNWPKEDPEYEKLRLVAEQQNMDEFLEPVLQNYKYVEVDLWGRGLDRHPQDDYDEEIREDMGTWIAGLGEGGLSAKVPDFQSAVAEEIQKKEAFNRLLSDMISPNRSVPDTRENT